MAAQRVQIGLILPWLLISHAQQRGDDPGREGWGEERKNLDE